MSQILSEFLQKLINVESIGYYINYCYNSKYNYIFFLIHILCTYYFNNFGGALFLIFFSWNLIEYIKAGFYTAAANSTNNFIAQVTPHVVHAMNDFTEPILNRVDDVSRIVTRNLVEINTNLTDNSLNWQSIIKQTNHHKIGLGLCLTTLSKTKYDDMLGIMAEMGKIASLLGLETSVINSFLERMSSAVLGQLVTEQITQQAGGIDPKRTAAVLAAVATTFGININNSDPVAFLTRASSNAQALEKLWEMFEEYGNDLGLWETGNYQIIATIAQKVAALEGEFEYFNNIFGIAPADVLKPSNQVRWRTFREEFRAVQVIVTNPNLSPKVKTSGVFIRVQFLLTRVQSWEVEFKKLEQSITIRPVPVGVCLTGESQLGKSKAIIQTWDRVKKLLRSFSQAPLRNEFDAQVKQAFTQANNFTYWPMQSRDEYDTGYNGNEAVYEDDAFKDKDHKDHKMWLSFISGQPIGTVQAHLESKGRPFKALLAMVSCNHLPTGSTTINNIDALHNRFPITAYTKLKTGFQPKTSQDVYDPDFSHLEFHVKTMANHVCQNKARSNTDHNSCDCTIVNIQQLSELIAVSMIHHQEQYVSELNSLRVEQIQQQNNDDDSLPLIDTSIPDINSQPNLSPSYREELLKLMNYTLATRPIEALDDPRLAWAKYLNRKEEHGGYWRMPACSFENYANFKINGNSFTVYDFLSTPRNWSIWDQENFIKTLSFLPRLNIVRDPLTNQFFLWGPALCKGTVLCHIPESHLDKQFTSIEELTGLTTECFNNILIGKEWIEPMQSSVSHFVQSQVVTLVAAALQDIFTALAWENIVISRMRYDRKPYFNKTARWVEKDVSIFDYIINPGEWLNSVEVGRTMASVFDYYRQVIVWLSDGFTLMLSKFFQIFGFESTYILETLIEVTTQVTIGALRLAMFPLMGACAYALVKFFTKPKEEENQISSQNYEHKVQTRQVRRQVRPRRAPKSKGVVQQIVAQYDQSLTDELAEVNGELDCVVCDYLKDKNIDDCNNYVVVQDEDRSLLVFADHIALNSGEMMMQALQLVEASQKNGIVKQLLINNVHNIWHNEVEIITLPHDVLTGEFKTEFLKVSWEWACGRNERVTTVEFQVNATDACNQWQDLVEQLYEYVLIRTFDLELRFHPTVILGRLYIHTYYEEDDFSDGHIRSSIHFTRELRDQIFPRGLTAKDIITDVFNGKPADTINTQSDDDVSLAIIHTVIENNLVNVCKVRDFDSLSVDRYGCSGIASGKFIMIPAHVADIGDTIRCIHQGKDNGEVVIKRLQSEQLFLAKVISCDEKREIAMALIMSKKEGGNSLKLLDSSPVYKDISHHMMTDVEAQVYLKQADTVLYLPRRSFLVPSQCTYVEESIGFGLTKPYPIHDKRWLNVSGLPIDTVNVFGVSVSNVVSSNGDCGGPLMIMNPRCRKKFLGFHVGASSNFRSGRSALITLDLFTDLTTTNVEPQQCNMIISTAPIQLNGSAGYGHLQLKNWPMQTWADPEQDYFYRIMNRNEEGDNLPEDAFPIGKLIHDSPAANLHKGLSDWLKSPFFGAFENEFAPAPITGNDPRITGTLPTNRRGEPSLLMKQSNLFNGPSPTPDKETLELVLEQSLNYFKLIMADDNLHSSTDEHVYFEEALNGRPNNKHFQGVEYRTSPGLPWTAAGIFSKKEFVQDTDGVKSFRDTREVEQLKCVVRNFIIQGKKNKRVTTLYGSKLKDSLIKNKHIQSGKVRIFQGAPFEIALLGAILFGPFKEAYVSHADAFRHALGINVHSRDWHHIADKLFKFEKFMAIDFSEWDKRLISILMRIVATIIIETIGDDGFKNVRYVYMEQYITALIVDIDSVWQAERGNKSGDFLTTIVNCIMQWVYWFYIFIRLTGRTDISSFLKFLAFVVFGDDITLSEDDELSELINFHTVAIPIAELGGKYTLAMEGKLNEGFQPLSELSFLKRYFHQDRGVWLGRLEKESIEKTFSFSKVKHAELDVWQQIVAEHLMEAMLWGEEYFNFFKESLTKAMHNNRNSSQFILTMSPVLSNSYESVRNDYFVNKFQT